MAHEHPSYLTPKLPKVPKPAKVKDPNERRGRKKKSGPALVVMEQNSTYADRPTIEDGKDTGFTYPVLRDYPRAAYERDMKTQHLGFKHFAKSHSLDALKLALSRDGSMKAQRFLAALIHPDNVDKDIADLAEQYKIGFGDLMALWRNDKLNEAIGNLFDAAPTVAAHTAIDAESTQTCCSRCDGAGVMKVNIREEFSWIQCVSCNGTGAVRKIGDAKSREYVFNATGITKMAAGMSVIVNTGAASSVESVIDEMEQAPAIPVTYQMEGNPD